MEFHYAKTSVHQVYSITMSSERVSQDAPNMLQLSLAGEVLTNLVHYNLWTEVQEHQIAVNGHETTILSGLPPAKLDSTDAPGSREWVVPKRVSLKDLPLEEINAWFEQILLKMGQRPKRITVGLANDDATVVYYFVHDGIVKPRKN